MQNAGTVDVVNSNDYAQGQEQAWMELVDTYPDLKDRLVGIVNDPLSMAFYTSNELLCTTTLDRAAKYGMLALSEVLSDGVARQVAYTHPIACVAVGMSLSCALDQMKDIGNIQFSVRPLVVGVCFDIITRELYPTNPAAGLPVAESIMGIDRSESEQHLLRFCQFRPVVH